MYMTFFAGSPCAKTVSFFRNLPTLLPKPVESRNDCASKAGLLDFAFLGERRTLTDTRRGLQDSIRQNSMERESAECTILNTTSQPAPHRRPPQKSVRFLLLNELQENLSCFAVLSAMKGALLI